MRIKTRRSAAFFAAAVLLIGGLIGGLVFAASAAEAPAGETAVPAGARKTLYDFETEYERAGVDSGYIFGTIKRSGEHVTSGSNSLYLEVSGHSDEDNELHYAGTDHEFWATNYIGLKTSDELYADARDLSAYDTFTVDFYNESDRDTSVTVYLQTNMNGQYVALNGHFQRLGRRVLPKGKASYLDFDLTYLQYNGLDEVMRIWFFFDNIDFGQTPLKLYMDNVAVERRQADFTLPLPQPVEEDGVIKISSFETILETQMAVCTGYGVAYDQMPSPERNNDPAYVTDGEHSLKITLAKTNWYCRCTSEAWGRSCHLGMPGALYFGDFNVNEMLAASGKEAKDFVAAIDVYNPGDATLTMSVLGQTNYKFPPGWTTVRTSLSDLAFATSGTITLTFGWTEFRDLEDRVFYVDNFRIEAAAAGEAA